MKTLLLSLSFVALGCSSKPAQTPPALVEEDRDPLPDAKRLRCGFSWQQEVSASYGPLESSFTAVVECSGAELTVVGLTPFGTRAFLLRQSGENLHFEKFVDRELPFSPRQILADLHRTFFVGYLEGESPEERFFGESRKDDRVGDRLVKRTLSRDDRPGKSTTIVYEGGFDGVTPPPKVVLENGYYGYRLEVSTLAAEKLGEK